MQLAAEGQFKGHPDGPFEITRAHLESMLTAARKRRSDIVIDLEHEGGPATGWVDPQSVELGRDEHGRLALFGVSRWTPKFAEAIRGEEYRYFSPVIAFGTVDRESGDALSAELIEGALTNNPFIDGMSAVALSRLRALNVHGGTMEDMPTEEPQPEASSDDAGKMAMLGELALKALGVESVDDAISWLQENSSPEELINALMEKAGGAMPAAEPAPEQMAATRALRDEVRSLGRQIKDLKAQNKQIRDESDAVKVRAELGDDLSSEQVTRYVALRRTDAESYAEIRAARGKASPPNGRTVELSRNTEEQPPLVKDLSPEGQRLYASLKGTSISKESLLKAIQNRGN